jgi:amidophosphoribosyltransferase
LPDKPKHECGLAALCLLDEPYHGNGEVANQIENVAGPMTSMLLDLQNRGQLAAGFTTYEPERDLILKTFKDVGTVSEAVRISHAGKHESILVENSGRAAIGHTRYATSGEEEDIRYAQPFERQHGRLWKWFALAFNGNIANYSELRERLLSKRGYHFTLNTDTEIIMHNLSYRLRGERRPDLTKVMAGLNRDFDGAFNIAFMDAMGRMFVSRDPVGFRPMAWAVKGRLFAAANESVALRNLGFDEINHLEPGEMAIVEDGKLKIERFAKSEKKARCFFEWVYFSNVASEIDYKGVYHARARSGRILAEMEDQEVDDTCIVVPVPDTAKAAADAYAFNMGMPCMEGVIRNRYVGRTFIQPVSTREKSAKSKYTTVRSLVKGQRVFLVEDSIVRSTTLKTLVKQVKADGAEEVHVRVACPPIVGPCFYGIDMSTLGELHAPKFTPPRYKGEPTPDMLKKMARSLNVDSIKYLPVSALGDALDVKQDTICTGCVTTKYPTPWGNKLIRQARKNQEEGIEGRTYA